MAKTQPGEDRRQLRDDAESRLTDHSDADPAMRARPAEELLHELQVHHIELEMQNEELRQAQQVIEESRDRYLDLYDFAPIGYLTLDRSGVIAEANLTVETLFGIPRKELLKRRFTNFVSPQDSEHWSRQFMHSMNQGEKQGCELALKRADGSLFHAQLDSLRMERSGEPPLLRIALTDITARKQAEQALIDADTRKDEFLAMLGHELRNPLTPIRNAAYVLGLLETQEPQVRWAQEVIERQVIHLARLVDDLLDVSRIVRGKITLRPETLSLAGVVDRTLDMARPLIEAKGHRLELHLPERPVWLRGDPVRLAQVLLNLLDNAAKYTPEGGCIELGARVVEQSIEIRVRDNGSGIPCELLPRIFDLFQQGERALDRAQGGLGIGLTLAKRLLEMHGGRIEAASAGPGRGSEFTIRLPALADTATSAGTDTGGKNMPKTPHATASCRVLVVDDDRAVAVSMAALLTIEGHDVRTATNGEAALELARGFRPQLVLLDIGLIGMDGYEVARRLRDQQPPGERMSLVAVTGYGHEEARTRSRDAGFDRHLVKPVFPEAICALLAEIGGEAATRTRSADAGSASGKHR